MSQITLKIKNMERSFNDIYDLKQFIEFVEEAIPNNKSIDNKQLIKFLENKYDAIPTYKAKNLQEIFNKAGI